MDKKIDYPYLPPNKDIFYVSSSNQFIDEAKDAAQNLSTDHNHSTGAVVVKDSVIIGKAGNQTPVGNNKTLIKLHKNICIRKIFKIPSGQKYWLCPGCSNYSDHAEQQAIKDAIKKGNDPKDADLYLWGHWWCCKPCWDNMIENGIKNVYLLEDSVTLFKK